MGEEQEMIWKGTIELLSLPLPGGTEEYHDKLNQNNHCQAVIRIVQLPNFAEYLECDAV